VAPRWQRRVTSVRSIGSAARRSLLLISVCWSTYCWCNGGLLLTYCMSCPHATHGFVRPVYFHIRNASCIHWIFVILASVWGSLLLAFISSLRILNLFPLFLLRPHPIFSSYVRPCHASPHILLVSVNQILCLVNHIGVILVSCNHLGLFVAFIVDFVCRLDYLVFFYLGHFVCHLALLCSSSDKFVCCLLLLDRGSRTFFWCYHLCHHHIIIPLPAMYGTNRRSVGKRSWWEPTRRGSNPGTHADPC
jgi:hypothetical protein